jgi:hypothetical protein
MGATQMVQATKTLSHPAPEVITLARWLAKKAYKEELRAMGRRPDQMEIGQAAWAYFAEHREEFIREARAHPALISPR